MNQVPNSLLPMTLPPWPAGRRLAGLVAIASVLLFAETGLLKAAFRNAPAGSMNPTGSSVMLDAPLAPIRLFKLPL